MQDIFFLDFCVNKLTDDTEVLLLKKLMQCKRNNQPEHLDKLCMPGLTQRMPLQLLGMRTLIIL